MHYRTILKKIIEQESKHRLGNREVEVYQICDDIHQHYQHLYVGWQAGNRVFSPIIHKRIHNNKIWIEHDALKKGLQTSCSQPASYTMRLC